MSTQCSQYIVRRFVNPAPCSAVNVTGLKSHDSVCTVGMMARVMLTGTVYKKIFELSQETIGEVTLGKILNLMSYDVQRLDIVSVRVRVAVMRVRMDVLRVAVVRVRVDVVRVRMDVVRVRMDVVRVSVCLNICTTLTCTCECEHVMYIHSSIPIPIFPYYIDI